MSKLKLTILIIGCGDIGVTLGQELLDEGHRVIGVRRQAKALEHTGIEPLALDLSTLEGADASALPQADYVIYTVSADRFEESAYQSAYPDGLKRVLTILGDLLHELRHPGVLVPRWPWVDKQWRIFTQHPLEALEDRANAVPHLTV